MPNISSVHGKTIAAYEYLPRTPLRVAIQPRPGPSFSCDAEGRVQMDLLGDRAIANYLYARVVVGREYAIPRVGVVPSH